MPLKGDSYSTSELSGKSGDIIAETLRGPVTIAQAGTLETMPDSLFSDFEDAVEAYAREDETARS